MDGARCIHAMRDRLCVARESGKLNIYALPTLGFLQTYRLDLEVCTDSIYIFTKISNRTLLHFMISSLEREIFAKK